MALNTFDAQSGGARLMPLRKILQRPEVNRQLHRLQSREALIAFFRKPTTFAFHSPTWAGHPLPC